MPVCVLLVCAPLAHSIWTRTVRAEDASASRGRGARSGGFDELAAVEREEAREREGVIVRESKREREI